MKNPLAGLFTRRKAVPLAPGELVFNEPEAKLIYETSVANQEAGRRIGGKVTPWVDLDYLSEGDARLETRYRRLVDKGTITARELFQLDFGGLPVPVEQMSSYHLLDKPIGAKWTNTLPRSTWGQADVANGSFVMNDKVRYERPLMGTVGHEAIHILSEFYEKYAPIPNETFRVKDDVDGVFGAEMSQALFSQRKPGSNSGPMNEAFESFRKAMVAQSEIGYYFSRSEMLPRLHQMMVDIHHETGELPRTPLQLFAAFHSAGIRTPKEIITRISSPENAEEVAAFRKPIELAPYETTRELSRKLAKLPEANLKAFWENVLPAYVGDLWNLYGHRNGREMMGVPTADPEGARAFLALANDASLTKTPRKLEPLARGVHSDYAVQLLQRMIESDQGEAAKSLIKTHRDTLLSSPHWEHGMPLLWIATKGKLQMFEYALQNGFSANEVFYEKDGAASGSTLDILIDSVSRMGSKEGRKHAIEATQMLLKHGADPNKLLHCYDQEDKPSAPISQWLREDFGANSVQEYLRKLEKRPVAAQRPTMVLEVSVLVRGGQGIEVLSEIPGGIESILGQVFGMGLMGPGGKPGKPGKSGK